MIVIFNIIAFLILEKEKLWIHFVFCVLMNLLVNILALLLVLSDNIFLPLSKNLFT